MEDVIAPEVVRMQMGEEENKRNRRKYSSLLWWTAKPAI